MAPNPFYLLDEELRPWLLDADSAEPWPDCRYFGRVFRAFDRAGPDLGLRLVLTDRVTGALPIRGDDVVVVCIRDELSRMPSYAHDVRLVAKTYGVTRTANQLQGGSPLAVGATIVQEGLVQGRRLPALLVSQVHRRRRPRPPVVVEIPLGTYLLDDVPFVPFGDRPFDVSYAGSRLNSSKEGRRRIPTQKMRSRRELEASVQALRGARPDIRLGVHIIDQFRDAPAHSGTYSRLLMGSRITLCPRGGSLETYRFFEALCCGSVPVTERLPRRDFYTGAPGGRVERWSELAGVLDRLLADPEGLQAAHEAALAWWSQRCSPEAVASRLLAEVALTAPT